MSEVNKSDRKRICFPIAYNRASNNPTKKHHHSSYSPLTKVGNIFNTPDSFVTEAMSIPVICFLCTFSYLLVIDPFVSVIFLKHLTLPSLVFKKIFVRYSKYSVVEEGKRFQDLEHTHTPFSIWEFYVKLGTICDNNNLKLLHLLFKILSQATKYEI